MTNEVKMIHGYYDNAGWTEEEYICHKDGTVYILGVGNEDWDMTSEDDYQEYGALEDEMSDVEEVMVSFEDLVDIDDNNGEYGNKAQWLYEVFGVDWEYPESEDDEEDDDVSDFQIFKEMLADEDGIRIINYRDTSKPFDHHYFLNETVEVEDEDDPEGYSEKKVYLYWNSKNEYQFYELSEFKKFYEKLVSIYEKAGDFKIYLGWSAAYREDAYYEMKRAHTSIDEIRATYKK